MKSGIINVYKEAGYTSFDVVAKLRGILHMKKIGHTGTLDPEATGVLPVCIGKATKVCDLLTDKDKVYQAVMRLGITTDTLDLTGTVLTESPVTVTPEEVSQVISDFTGDIYQIPPMYSALKVNGRKLCDLARAGVEVERKPRPVHIFSIEILEMDLPRVRMQIHCSKGTYIRTLCDDIGEKLGCGACMESLIRTRVAGFSIEDALPLAEIEALTATQQIEEHMVSIDQVFSAYPRLVGSSQANKQIVNGGKLAPEDLESDSEELLQQILADADGQKELYFRLYLLDDTFVGVYQWKDARLVLRKMFLE